ncbi:MAG: SIMPL domain-containing protein [Hyphomonadaceae bacterium]|nr:SIMPL domain-containing protein [Hyphomonadaceae bacterium]
MSSIQPETTITLMGRGSIEQPPDVAMINVGVQVEAKTAAEAMAQQATNMNGVFAAVKAAGIADRDMQTGNMSLNPVYEYPNNARPRLTGYQASNSITIKVRKLDTLGKTLDAVVKGGGNTINGISFSVDQPDKFQNEARVEAIKDAAAKAELYAQAVGYKVKRIVTISEQEFYPQPPMPVMMRMQDMAAEATPIAAGEVSLVQTVNVVFELTK